MSFIRLDTSSTEIILVYIILVENISIETISTNISTVTFVVCLNEIFSLCKFRRSVNPNESHTEEEHDC